jgi:putative tryptophan/tyrosine transport system substrate-binding protein
MLWLSPAGDSQRANDDVTVDTPFQAVYARPQDLLEDITMPRRAISLVIPLLLGLLVVPLAAEAQQAAKVARVGFLAPDSTTPERMRELEAFRQGLPELGWVEGQNLVIEARYTKDRYERLPDLAAELVGLKVDVIVTGAAPAIRAVQHATKTIAIVFVILADPEVLGFVASLARPGGNITGLENNRGPQLNRTT